MRVDANKVLIETRSLKLGSKIDPIGRKQAILETRLDELEKRVDKLLSERK